MSTFVDAVHERAATAGGRTVYSYLKDATSDVVTRSVTYGELDRGARRIAALLGDLGVRTGDRVLLLFTPGLDFVEAFVGCLFAGAVAVPAPPPDRFRAAIDRTAAIMRDADPAAILCAEEVRPHLPTWLAEQGRPHLPCFSVDDAAHAPETWPDTVIAPGMLAFLQYTSGSTSEPKGVMVSHGNLVANLDAIRRWAACDEHTRSVGWLPAIHDLGLIGQILGQVYWGGELLLMPPTEFVRRPYHWLRHVDRFGADISGGPNFAYDMCVKRITDEQIATLDLSRWKVAINGAEPVLAKSLRAFADRFAPAGFRPAAFAPCYGLAEATLLVTGSGKGRGAVTKAVDADALAQGTFMEAGSTATTRTSVSSGAPIGCAVKIVDPATSRPKKDGEVGEIWVRGPAVTRGYWRRADITGETFDATTSTGETGFLRTGDLGALVDGELHVTGRLKDVLVVRGRNLYPQDLEASIREVDARRCAGASAVFAFSDALDDVVVVQEILPTASSDDAVRDITTRIRTVLVDEYGIQPPSVVLVRPGEVRKTTSGKVRRSLMRELFLNFEITFIHEDISERVSALRGAGMGAAA
jgi:acyl-CoA synthetase (AMP-forming)/AMP-acid ligase II